MKKTLTQLIIGFSLVSITSIAQAKSFYDYAKVKSARAVYQNVVIKQPIQQCYQVEYRRPRHNPAPIIAGTIVGGIIGNAIGDSKASTIAGAVIGGSIAHDSQPRKRYIDEHCEIVEYKRETVRKLKGYKVKYRYKGETYHTFMKKHPGDKVKVRVKVTAAYYP